MDALQMARQLLDEAANCWRTYENTDQNPYWSSRAQELEERAARYAAVAQAEALMQIAERMEHVEVTLNDK
jgi:hypothetical protein